MIGSYKNVIVMLITYLCSRYRQKQAVEIFRLPESKRTCMGYFGGIQGKRDHSFYNSGDEIKTISPCCNLGFEKSKLEKQCI